ncbi:MAG: hypothetical protein US81_C0042G0005 [Parcubacteria group bacterium GW2011_GWE2_38_18]|nr:MAG: hypothetical protein US81_C0042G0005 [Parcubacteria group bacterium GW2011_GWE2_38_18]
MQFIFGLIGLAIGVGIVIKSESILNTFGRIEFFEHYLGVEGGSRLGYKLFGVLVIFIAILLITGMFNGFMMWAVSPLTQFSQTQ